MENLLIQIMIQLKSLQFSAVTLLSEVLIKNKYEDKQVFYEFIKKQFDLSDAAFELHRKFVDQFVTNHKWRWQKKSKFRRAYFEKHFGSWLEQTFELPEITFKEAVRKDFAECSVRTKKRRGEQLRQEKTPEEIELAFIANLNQTDRDGAEIIKRVLSADTETKNQICEILRGSSVKKEIPYTPDEALALFIDMKGTRQKYELLRSQALSRNSGLYPPYYKVAEAKKHCYPDDIDITSIGVRIPLQALLDHTAHRLIQQCDQLLFQNVNRNRTGWELITKWGMDGASGQSMYKQIFSDNPSTISDNSVFMISMVPLRIRSAAHTVWTNPHPSSTKFCRPISFHFTKEKEETTVQYYQNIDEQIQNLKPTVIKVGETRIRLNHKLFSTMLDGKSIGYLSSTADCNCCICGATPKEMSDVQKIRLKDCAEENYQFGLSSLHCWIRFLECILHIAFKLPIEKWKASTPEEKAKVEKQRDDIQKAFRDEKGLYLDFVRPGAGNSNDGNTARRFFREWKYAADVTRVDKELIKRFYVILVAITSRKKLDVPKFEKYASDTIDRYNTFCRWYFMPVTVHKILFHGAKIIEFFDLPIGFYSEEAQESRNKDFKRIRECNTRKTSRQDTNEDIIHGLLMSSDPVISHLRKDTEPKVLDFDPEVKPEVMHLLSPEIV